MSKEDFVEIKSKYLAILQKLEKDFPQMKKDLYYYKELSNGLSQACDALRAECKEQELKVKSKNVIIKKLDALLIQYQIITSSEPEVIEFKPTIELTLQEENIKKKISHDLNLALDHIMNCDPCSTMLSTLLLGVEKHES